jgi:hypothetical protein
MSDQIVSPAPNGPPQSTLVPPPELMRERFSINHTTICSVYPGDLTHRLLHSPSGAGRTNYFIPAVPLDDPSAYELLHVWDAWATTLDTASTLASSMDTDSTGAGESGKKYQLSPVPSRTIAYDLVRHWAGDAPGARVGLTIGVGTIAGDVPSEEELASLRGIQSAYFRFLVEQAHTYHAQGLTKEITDYHRRALRWLGSEDAPWYPKIERSIMKQCPACDERIKSTAVVCQHCRTNLPEYYAALGYKLHEVQALDAVVGAALDRMLKMQQRTAKGRD